MVGSLEEVGQRLGLGGVVDSLEEGQIAASLNKSDNSGYLETVKYVE